MVNHFHLLRELPYRGTLAPLDEAGLLAVLPPLYDEDTVEGVRQELERAQPAREERRHKEILDCYEKRRGSLAQFMKALRHRVRHCCDGSVLGHAECVAGFFEREKAKGRRFGGKRKTGARRMRGADWGGLRVLRDLQREGVGK